MELRDELLTVAELAIGIAGFSAVVAAFSARGHLHESDLYRFRGLIVIAATAAGLAFVPSLLSSSGVSGPTLWSTASAIMIVAWFAAVIPFGLLMRNLRRDPEQDPNVVPSPAAIALLAVPTVSNLLVQTSNVFGVGGESSGAPYLFGTLVWLWAAGVLFVGIVTRRPAD
jgi:hypothetical protein